MKQNKIQILDNETINAIAAGEVIENPASVIKELVENSIDAGSTQITVAVENAGKSSIRVTDNGRGMNLSDLKMAFLPHSTSKLTNINDLQSIETMGFRGEALASISAVSPITCITREKNANKGLKAFIEKSTISSIKEIGTQVGTTIEVKNLFEYLPVRKKFMKSNRHENNLITDLINRFALSYPNIGFTFIRDNRIVIKTNANQQSKDLIYTVLGYDTANNVVHFEREEGEIHIEGYLSNNLLYKSNRNHQYVFINNRMVKFPELISAIEYKYRSVIPLQKYPVFIISIEVPPAWVDVNIHPNKSEVSIDDHSRLIQLIEQATDDIINRRKKILNTNIKNKTKDKPIDKETIFDIDWNKKLHQQEKEKESLIINNKNKLNNKDRKSDIPVEVFEWSFVSEDSKEPEGHLDEKMPEKVTEKEKIYDENNQVFKDLLYASFVGVLFQTYIIFQYKDNVFFCDQHAAHERIRYEHYLTQFKNNKLATQPLLSPIVIDASVNLSDETTVLEELKKLGYHVDVFDETSYILREVPIIHGVPIESRQALDVIEFALSTDEVNEDHKFKLPIDKIMRKSCKSAIKSGDVVKETEAYDLIKQLSNTKFPLTCPHGRPTVIEMSKKDLEKMFLREMS